ncbi:PREDICTED: spermidine synthase-like [Amphimedon queenslandica]|uniref:Spermidine synthase n=1 Tax=Amphimedon queenslandica TaxID=400682 RepID=A0A1X7UTK6_AMPQE|nr:PREDICTED: spermidine synthase-like [Amphimedon queenslandica]|eukprot:XP_019852469.1 PREDICTED: spermidine synthase-like [Amphimedon queenslandica]
MSDTTIPSVVSRDGWFSEINDLWPGECFSLKVDEILHQERSQYQDIMIFKSKAYGMVLVLDGVIQCTERDEFSYQEMIAHLPLFSHPNPKSVLIIGGGDGGVVREVIKHPSVEQVHLCEIDERVIELSKKYLPSLSSALSSPKVTVHVKDGVKFLEDHVNEFDVIITDSSDPIGPAIPLFERPYYEKTKNALKDGGVLCCQGECVWLDLKLISSCMSHCHSVFPVASYAYTTIPTYPCGQIGFFLASKDKNMVFEEPTRCVSDEEVKRMKLKYYNAAIHRASFVLPQFVKEALPN